MSTNVGRLTAAAGRLRQAPGLPAVLDPPSAAFEQILAVIGDHEAPTAAVDIPLVMAATQAANGRDALLFAPSLPPRRVHQRRPETAQSPWPDAAAFSDQHPQRRNPRRLHHRATSAPDIAAAVAAVSMPLATQLAHTARTIATGSDRAACQDAAEYAQAICGLLARAGP